MLTFTPSIFVSIAFLWCHTEWFSKWWIFLLRCIWEWHLCSTGHWISMKWLTPQMSRNMTRVPSILYSLLQKSTPNNLVCTSEFYTVLIFFIMNLSQTAWKVVRSEIEKLSSTSKIEDRRLNFPSLMWEVVDIRHKAAPILLTWNEW